jgi:hypothetical protein
MTRNPSLRTAFIALIGGWIGGLLSSIVIQGYPVLAEQGSPATIVTAQEFRVVDKDETLRTIIGMQPDGTSGATFYDPHGKIRAEIGVNAAGVSEFALYDEHGKQRTPKSFAYMFVLPNGGPRLSLIGDAANLTIASDQRAGYATLKIEPDNNPVLSLEGEDKGAALLTMLQDGSPSFTLYDPEGYRRAALEIKEHRLPGKKPIPKSTLTLYDPNEKVIWSAP